MLTSEIEKTHLFNDFSTNALSFLMNSSMALLKTCVKCRAVALGYANAQPSGSYKISKPHPLGWERKQISAPRLPGGNVYCRNWLMHLNSRTRIPRTSGEESVEALLVNFRFSSGFAGHLLILISLTLYFLLAQSVLLTRDHWKYFLFLFFFLPNEGVLPVLSAPWKYPTSPLCANGRLRTLASDINMMFKWKAKFQTLWKAWELV